MGKTVRHPNGKEKPSHRGKEKSKGPEHVEKKERRAKKERVDKFYNTHEERQFMQFLNELNLQFVEMKSDGNCLFRSIAHQLRREPVEETHTKVRNEIMDYMEREKALFMHFVDVDGVEDVDEAVFDEYIERMRGYAEWGGYPEIYAAAQCFGVDIVVHQWDAPRYVIAAENKPANAPNGVSAIQLSYHGECHYNSVMPLDPSLVTATQPLAVGSSSNAKNNEDFQERVRRAVPWVRERHIAAAVRELQSESRAHGVDDVIDFLCANMEAIQLGAFDEEEADNTSAEELITGEKTEQREAEPAVRTEKEEKVEKAKNKDKTTKENETITKGKPEKVKGANKVLSKKERRQQEKLKSASPAIDSSSTKDAQMSVFISTVSSNQTDNMKEIVL